MVKISIILPDLILKNALEKLLKCSNGSAILLTNDSVTISVLERFVRGGDDSFIQNTEKTLEELEQFIAMSPPADTSPPHN